MDHSGRLAKYNDLTSRMHDIDKTLSSFEELKDQYDRIKRSVHEWREQRHETINTIQRLTIELDNVFVNCNIAQNVGSAVGIVGGFAGIVGAVLTLTGNKSASQFLDTSKTCCTIRGFTSASATLLELGLSKRIMDKVKMEVRKDQELTKPFEKWMEHSLGVDSLLEQFFECNIRNDIIREVVQVCTEGLKFLETGEMEFNDLMEELKSGKMQSTKIVDLPGEVVQKVLGTMERIKQHPGLREPVRNICNIFQKSPMAFELIKLGVILHFKVCRLALNAMPNVLSLSSLASSKICDGSIGMGCFLNTINIAGNVVSYMLSTNNIEEGKSNYSEALNEIRLALTLELNATLPI